ncbi:hypothetical protein RYX36_036751, partial [Vicia faba]
MMSSRANQSKHSRYTARSSSHSRQSAEAKQIEFDNTRFIGPLHQARFYSLAERQIWPEKIFSLNPQGDYRYFVDDMEKRKCGVLLTPLTELNFEIIREFYANAMPITYVCYSYCSFVRGRAVSFDRNSVNQYLNHPLTLQRGELCSYQKRVASKKWRLDLVNETLALTSNLGFFSMLPTSLYTSKDTRSYTSTIPIDTTFLLYYMIKGLHIYVAQ